jgi:hypothetical protein
MESVIDCEIKRAILEYIGRDADTGVSQVLKEIIEGIAYLFGE